MYEEWRSILLRALAHVEAVIDFGEDEDVRYFLLIRVHMHGRFVDSLPCPRAAGLQ